MYVHSPWTKDTPVCQLDRWIDIPANGTVYVDDRPADDTDDPNSWTSTDPRYQQVQDACDQQGGNPVGYPVAGEARWDYDCTSGDVFIQELNGSSLNGLDGRLTVASAGSIYITDALHYSSTTALLGLVANEYIWYWHGITADKTNINLPAKQYPTQAAKSAPLQNLTVLAAMVSLQHQIGIMNFDKGAPLGKLNVHGNLTMRYRGPVGTAGGDHGYLKNYAYDSRLKYDAPPHFLNPQTSSFVSTRSAEMSPAYRAGQ
jgi:hypothetical protein